MRKKIGAALVVGSGISGIRSALDLAEQGYHVTLIERAAHLGGVLTQLDYQFPSDHCGMCKMLPLVERDTASQYCLRKGLFHENIDILLQTELKDLAGEPGKFQATLRQAAARVDPERCIGCGACSRICPVECADAFNRGLTRRKAVYLPVPHNIPNTYTIDLQACTRCGECEKICPTGAIDLKREAEIERQIEVGAVILSGGFESYDPRSGKNPYGYGKLAGVMTSLEYERLISGTGLFQGELRRPDNGRKIEKIAWLQCVGSRDQQAQADFCSSICCMFAIKEALLAKEKSPSNVETAIFYMDMRTFGKDFQRYHDRAEQEQGVRFVRSRVASVEAGGAEGKLRVQYWGADNRPAAELFDLVVLATGQRPASGMEDLAHLTGLTLNPWGFCESQGFSQSRTNREGIFLAGSFSGLKDISESVIQSGSASLNASRLIHSKGGGLAVLQENKQKNLRNVTTERPQVLVALCRCGQNTKEIGNPAGLVDWAKQQTGVQEVYLIDRACTREGWEDLQEKVKNSPANRMLIGACQPYTYQQSKWQNLVEVAGLSPRLMEVVDIQTALFSTSGHAQAEALQGSRNILAMGLAKVRSTDPTGPVMRRMQPKALVVGGGIAGLTAALAIAEHGYGVDLIEQSDALGGNLRELQRILDGAKPQELLQEILARIEKHSKIRVLTKTRVLHAQGRAGLFITTIEKENNIGETLVHGVTVLAVGGKEAPTKSYGHGQSPAILTQHELEQQLDQGRLDAAGLKRVAMIQCVDSREEPRNYCSRLCCSWALKNALALKERNPDLEIYVFYRDLMAYGFLEQYYTRARSQGVLFIQYDPAHKPQVEIREGRPWIAAQDPVLGGSLVLQPDLLVLSTGIVPQDLKPLAQAFGLETNPDGFFQEAESKWRPVDFLKEGVFMAGLAHAPHSLPETIATAEAAAERCLRLLDSEWAASGSLVAEVRPALCARCERCIAACPYGARWRDEETDRIQVDELMCQGCGTCAATCPNGASVLRGYRDKQILEMIDAGLGEVG
jgi:heterodisulfide reductase subunit A